MQYLLTGTVRWDKSKDGAGRIKVSPELIVVSTGESKWQESFDASISDVFQVQADVAGRVAQALNVALTEPAKHQLAEKPTASLAAYDAYLRGRSYELRSQAQRRAAAPPDRPRHVSPGDRRRLRVRAGLGRSRRCEPRPLPARSLRP